jgi:energy-coupling factor transport system ATP-binding protein
MGEVIQVQALHHTYLAGTPFEAVSLRGVNMNVDEGEIVAIIGPTGSGKSTLIQHFNGLIRPQKGLVRVFGKDVSADGLDLKWLRSQVGMVFQSPEQQLFEQYVGDDVAFGPRKLGLDRHQVRQRVREAMEAVGLDFEEFKDRLTFSLSGGEMRKAAIAGVLALQPRILVFDEPTSGLDPETTRQFLARIKEWQASRDLTVILVSHDMESVAALADRVYVLVGGQTVLEGRTREVFSQCDLLRAYGLDSPQISQVMHRLRGRGRDVRADVLSVVEAEQELCLSIDFTGPV